MMEIVGYPTPGKAKARVILEHFCKGAMGRVCADIPKQLPDGVVPVFYGVTPATVHLYRQARLQGRDWVYIDNAYFDAVRGKYFRATRNRLQATGRGVSDGKRFKALGVQIQPWRAPAGPDGHVLLCPQSAEFMEVVVDYPGDWTRDTLQALKQITFRPLRVRPWQRDKTKWYATLSADLKHCAALVTYSSASAITAMLAGVPAVVTGTDCISHCIASTALHMVDEPARSEDRARWAAVVADHQWTLEEMASGLCWEMMNAGGAA